MMIKANQVFQIHKICEDLNMSEEQYKSDIQTRFNVNTVLYLRFDQAQGYIEYLTTKKKSLKRQRLNPINYFRKLMAAG